ncbi:MAG TPA: hypothetical protein VLV48_03750 [Thermoanaerobaculia bacterium]|nr:hypothetical protein [Thermoanaerobaculia bacterium]
MAADQTEGGKPEIRYGLLYGIVISLLVEYGMLKFFLAHSGNFSRVEDYIQVGLALLVAIFFAALGIRYAVLLTGDFRRRD